MQLQPLRLFVLLVPPQAEPFQALENGVYRSLGIALHVGVVEAQDHGSTVVTGVEPVKNEGAGAADMQKTGRRRSKAHAGIAPRDCWMWNIAHIRVLPAMLRASEKHRQADNPW